MEQTVILFIEKHWGLILAIVGVISSLVWLKLDSRYAKKSDIKRDIGSLRDGQSNVSDRLDIVEQEIKHLPSADDVTSLRIAVEEMKGETRALHATTKGLDRLVGLLVEKRLKSHE